MDITSAVMFLLSKGFTIKGPEGPMLATDPEDEDRQTLPDGVATSETAETRAYKCGTCGEVGHNTRTCSSAAPAPGPEDEDGFSLDLGEDEPPAAPAPVANGKASSLAQKVKARQAARQATAEEIDDFLSL